MSGAPGTRSGGLGPLHPVRDVRAVVIAPAKARRRQGGLQGGETENNGWDPAVRNPEGHRKACRQDNVGHGTLCTGGV